MNSFIEKLLAADPQEAGPQFLEDLAVGYWFSEILFAAVEMEVFTHLEPEGMTVEEISRATGTEPGGTGRFLQALTAIGLLVCHGSRYYNTGVSADCLVKGRSGYQGDSLLWRKYLSGRWRNLTECLKAGGRVDYGSEDEDPKLRAPRIQRYIRAMDQVAAAKVSGILPLFEGKLVDGKTLNGGSLQGRLLDAGAGSGAVAAGFLERFPAMRATLVDLPEVLDYTGELIKERGLQERAELCPANILETWPVEKGGYDLVILSNIVHAYSEAEIPAILDRAAQCLTAGGFLLVHDFFTEHCPAKAAAFDLNMLINTYNGRVFSSRWIEDRLTELGLAHTGLIPLGSDTALIVAAARAELLTGLAIAPETRLARKVREIGFRSVVPIAVEQIHVPDWTPLRCRFGCSAYGRAHCPPNSPDPESTRKVLRDYSKALLLEGEPPTGSFQRLILEAEKEAFKTGFYKAFVYWAGPCSICPACPGAGDCRNTRDARPSMEGAGIDVFETARRAGFTLKTRKTKEDYTKYFGLLLLE